MVESRNSPRRGVREWAKILFEDGRPIQSCVILDISEGDAGLLVDRAVNLPGSFLLFRKSNLSLREAIVVRRAQKTVGVRLLSPLDLASERVKALGQLKHLSPIFS